MISKSVRTLRTLCAFVPSCAKMRANQALLIGSALLFLSALLQPHAAFADCTPVASSGSPAAGTVVTCTDVTTNRNDPSGYGTGNQTGLTINVDQGATVAGTNNGFDLGLTNTIVNAGTITDAGANVPFVDGIMTSGSIDLTNTATGVISVSTTDPSGGAFAVNPSTSLTGDNAGLISASANAQESTAIQSNAIDLTNEGTITASGSNSIGTFTIFGVNSLALTNSGTITADGGTGVTGTAVESAGTDNAMYRLGEELEPLGRRVIAPAGLR